MGTLVDRESDNDLGGARSRNGCERGKRGRTAGKFLTSAGIPSTHPRGRGVRGNFRNPLSSTLALGVRAHP